MEREVIVARHEPACMRGVGRRRGNSRQLNIYNACALGSFPRPPPSSLSSFLVSSWFPSFFPFCCFVLRKEEFSDSAMGVAPKNVHASSSKHTVKKKNSDPVHLEDDRPEFLLFFVFPF